MKHINLYSCYVKHMGSEKMKESLIFGITLKIYDRFMLYYKNSIFFMALQRMGKSFGKYAASSSILSFFDKEWNIGNAWNQSFAFKILMSPIRLLRYASQRFSDSMKTIVEGSKILKVVNTLLENLFNMDTRSYVLFFVTGIALTALLYFLQMINLILIVAGIAVGLLVLWRYEIGVFAVVGLIPLAPTMALLGLILLTAASFGIRILIDKSMKLRITILDYFVVLFGIILFYSFITSYTPGSSMLELLIHMAFIVFYFILVNTIKTREQLYVLAALLILSTTVTSIYGLYQLKTVTATSEAWVDTTLFEDIKTRVGSTFENPNVLGEYLVLIIPVAIAMLWGQKGWISRLITMGLTAIMLGCLVYTYSRGAYVGLMLALAMFAVLRDKRFVILCVIGLLMLPFVLPASVINRFASIGNLNDTSSFYRISVWLGSLGMAKDYWLSGIGLGLEPFKLVYPKYSLNAAYAHHSHNIYIQLIIETGIAGLLMFFAIIVVYYKTMLTGFYKTKDRFTSTFMIAIASGMAGYLAQGMVENIWYNNRVLLTFWVMLAFGMIAKALITEEKEVPGI